MKQRIAWIDNAKAIGMIAVFYGHFIEQLAGRNYTGLEFAQFKFIYSFHMPLFFFLSGFLCTPQPASADRYVLKKFYARIIPATFLNLLIIPLLIIQEDHLLMPVNTWEFALHTLQGLLISYPILNWGTWFLYCLFTVELIHFFASRWKAVPDWLKVFIFYVGGWLITWNLPAIVKLTHVPKNCWYIHEAIIAYSLFLMGIIANKSGVYRRLSPFIVSLVMCFILLVITIKTFNLNTGPFYLSKPGVNMSTSQHGNPLFFLLTSLAGIGFIITLSLIIPPNCILAFIGENTLVYLGLSVPVLFVGNNYVMKWLSSFPFVLSKTEIAFMGVCITMTGCVPLIMIINRLVPQLVGKPQKSGPLLPALVT
jgi:acyltransferase